MTENVPTSTLELGIGNNERMDDGFEQDPGKENHSLSLLPVRILSFHAQHPKVMNVYDGHR